ncbi:hypothetical protein BS17DRAFT_805624 [Gyrodon lividus]|nr:hypothetical protein BS17DRAFT_805624 [Gyrodon lividus]
MRLTYSTSNYLNTDISDEQGHKLYTISTPHGVNQVTTITKYHWTGQNKNSVPETMGVIEWHMLKKTLIRFNGRAVEADTMLVKRSWNTGRYFIGPDERSYKWKLGATYCWLKPAESDFELARFHKKNLGIMKESHPPYLDVSSRAVHMMDHIVLTYVYAEKLRRDQGERRHQSQRSALSFQNQTNQINLMNQMGMARIFLPPATSSRQIIFIALELYKKEQKYTPADRPRGADRQVTALRYGDECVPAC